MNLRNPMSHLDPGAHHIYLLPGFDPGGTRTLLRLLRQELAQAEPPLRLERLKSSGALPCWALQDRSAAKPAILGRLTLLSWDDIVRRRWAKPPWRLCWQGLLLYGYYLLHGRTLKTIRTLPKASFTFFWPMVFVMSLSLAALAQAVLIAVLPIAAGWKLLLIGCTLAGWLWFGLKQADRRRVDWLFRAIHFSCTLTHGEGDDLSKRLDDFAEAIASNIRSGNKERHVIVGYSSGAYLAQKVAIRVLEKTGQGPDTSKLQLITLGPNPAFLASISTREGFRRELRTLLDQSIPWIDFTCREDWMSFAEVELANVLGCTPGPFPQRRQVNLAGAAGLSDLKTVLNNQFVLHFQYFRHAREFSCLEWLKGPYTNE